MRLQSRPSLRCASRSVVVAVVVVAVVVVVVIGLQLEQTQGMIEARGAMDGMANDRVRHEISTLKEENKQLQNELSAKSAACMYVCMYVCVYVC